MHLTCLNPPRVELSHSPWSSTENSGLGPSALLRFKRPKISDLSKLPQPARAGQGSVGYPECPCICTTLTFIPGPVCRYLHVLESVAQTPQRQGWGLHPSLGYRIARFFVLFCYCFLGRHLRHMEVPRLGAESDLQLPAYTIATATHDPSLVCELHHSSRQCQILNPLSQGQESNPQPHGS